MTAICQEWDLRIEDWSIGGFGEEVWDWRIGVDFLLALHWSSDDRVRTSGDGSFSCACCGYKGSFDISSAVLVPLC